MRSMTLHDNHIPPQAYLRPGQCPEHGLPAAGGGRGFWPCKEEINREQAEWGVWVPENQGANKPSLTPDHRQCISEDRNHRARTDPRTKDKTSGCGTGPVLPQPQARDAHSWKAAWLQRAKRL